MFANHEARGVLDLFMRHQSEPEFSNTDANEVINFSSTLPPAFFDELKRLRQTLARAFDGASANGQLLKIREGYLFWPMLPSIPWSSRRIGRSHFP
jgi:hypothetical protein